MQKTANERFQNPFVEFAAPRAQPMLSGEPFLVSSLPDGEPWMAYYRCARGYLVRFFDFVDFEISATGTEIVVHSVPGVPPQTLDHLYQNQALPLALSLRLILVLHGSAIELGDHAIAFVAESGRGKSTLVASFCANGFRFLTDDGLRIAKSHGHFLVRPSHPSIRLWNDSREALVVDPPVTRPEIGHRAKARVLADERLRFCTRNRNLGHIYFLGDGSSTEVTITPVRGQDAIMRMLRNSFLLGVDKREMLAHNFYQLAELSRLPIFYYLDYPRRYDILSKVRASIIDHLCQKGMPVKLDI